MYLGEERCLCHVRTAVIVNSSTANKRRPGHGVAQGTVSAWGSTHTQISACSLMPAHGAGSHEVSPFWIATGLTYLPVLESQKAWVPGHQAAWSVERTKLAGLKMGVATATEGREGEKAETP